MIYQDFINSQRNKYLVLANEIFQRNKTIYQIRGSAIESYASIVVSLMMILKLKENDIKQDIIFDGRNDGAIDAIYINDKEKEIHIFDVKGTDGFDRNEIINIFLGEFKRNFLDYNTNLQALNKLAYKRISEARKKYLDKNYKVKIYFVRLDFHGDSSEIFRSYKKNFIKELSLCDQLSYRFIGSDELINKNFDKDKNEFNCELTFDNGGVFYDKTNKVAIGKIGISKIIEMVSKSEKPENNYNIFDDNVRVDQENETLESDLLKTLKSNKSRFFLFHNGITIGCSLLHSTVGKKFKLTNPQILNGCQSVKSLQRIYQDDKSRKFINRSLILCRLFEGKDSNDVNSVCQSTNSQRPINTWDLRTNDLIQKILEKLFAEKGYSYNRKVIRKRGFEKIIITDLAQWISACIIKEPAAAKSSKKNLFDISNGDNSGYFKKIFSKNYKIEDLAKVCSTCFFVRKYLNKMKKKEKNKDKKSFLDHSNFHIMAYVYNYGVNDIQSIVKAIDKCKKAAAGMRRTKKFGKEYSYNNIFKNKETWLRYF